MSDNNIWNIIIIIIIIISNNNNYNYNIMIKKKIILSFSVNLIDLN